ncbi:MAG: sugar transferase [Candidatus Eremiobacteraeota bacterium]|nr:sugar transferase [Candidatus Eremiobacteraeota bacterium]MBC5801665.1 sugar transferase [Candidatus Eremiobacteraeota bacterium]MBC5824053.1 sugar transferase [Candidatus Eremiobacteraeota bacterium]
MSTALGVRPAAPTYLVYRQNVAYSAWQRALDVAFAGVALIVTAPIVAVAALAIKLEDGGPVFFVQRRVGRFGRLFDLYKLRTMKVQACGDAPSPTTNGDRRVTRVGAFLRKTSIDEFPQFLNVVVGNMALVGPRPEQPFHVRSYAAPWQQLRHLVKPGITCLWQIRCRQQIPLHLPDATAHDVEYIGRASTVTDARIVLGTVRAVFSSQGAY